MDNPMILTMLSTFMMSKENNMWGLLFFFLFNIFLSNYEAINKIIKKSKIFANKHAKMTLKAKITYKNNTLWNAYYPVNFLAVNRQICMLLTKKKQCYNIQEFPTYDYKDNIMFLELDNSTILSQDVFAKSEAIRSSSSSDKGHNYEYVDLEITLHTPSKDFSKIKRFIEESMKQYNEEKIDTMKEQHIFVFSNIDKETKTPCYTEYPFTTTKTFENLFFDSKNKVLKRIDNFIDNKEEYVRLGMPYTLGILLYGANGCGKTSFCKALAEYTKRHVVIIPVNKVKNIDTLKNIFLSTEINYTKIPNYKRIYVFEDSDCSAWKNVLIKRELLPEYTAKEDHKEILTELITKIKPSEEELPKKEEMTLTLSEVLELLDGLVEIDGRIIVMTTNYIEMIDPALTRPGRFDIKLEMTKMSKQNISDLYKLWFDKELPKHVFENMKDYQFSQAQIGSLFSTRDEDEIFKTLCAEL